MEKESLTYQWSWFCYPRPYSGTYFVLSTTPGNQTNYEHNIPKQRKLLVLLEELEIIFPAIPDIVKKYLWSSEKQTNKQINKQTNLSGIFK